MAYIADKIAQIRQAVFGKDVRESIASGIEAINTEVESTTQRQTDLETEMAEAKSEAEEAADRANAAASEAEDLVEGLTVWEEYDAEKDYVPLNKVIYQGSSYINTVACKGVVPTNETNWLKIVSKGEQGLTGTVPDIVIGTTQTISAGSSATVTRRAGSPDTAPILDFGIPRGYDGEGSGDMMASTYDPGNKQVDAFNMANMDEGATKKIMTADERTKLAGIETGANKTTINNTLTSTSTTHALSAAQGKALKDEVNAHTAEKAKYQTATGSNAIVITTGGNFALTQGNWIKWIQASANTGAVTINIDSKGAKSIKDADGNALSTGDLEAGKAYEAYYVSGGDFFTLRPRGGDEIGFFGKSNKVYDVTYNADAMPQYATPAWTAAIGGTATVAISNSRLSIAGAASDGADFTREVGNVVASKTKEVYFKGKVVSGTNYSMAVYIGDGTRRCYLSFTAAGVVKYYNGPTYVNIGTGLPLTSEFTCKITMNNTAGVVVTINGTPLTAVPYASLGATAQNGINFGGTGATAAAWSAEFDYFYYILDVSTRGSTSDVVLLTNIKKDWYVYSNEDVQLVTTSSGTQSIPSIANATSETQLKAIDSGTLKTSGSELKRYSGFMSKKAKGWS